MSKVSTNINLEPELKKRAQELFKDLGLDLTTAVTLFLKQALREQGIPFEIKRETPTDETIQAMNEFYDMEMNPDKYKKYSSLKQVMEEVLEDA